MDSLAQYYRIVRFLYCYGPAYKKFVLKESTALDISTNAFGIP